MELMDSCNQRELYEGLMKQKEEYKKEEGSRSNTRHILAAMRPDDPRRVFLEEPSAHAVSQVFNNKPKKNVDFQHICNEIRVAFAGVESLYFGSEFESVPQTIQNEA